MKKARQIFNFTVTYDAFFIRCMYKWWWTRERQISLIYSLCLVTDFYSVLQRNVGGFQELSDCQSSTSLPDRHSVSIIIYVKCCQ